MLCINLWDTVYEPVSITLSLLSPCSFLLLILFGEGILFLSVSSVAKISLKHLLAAAELRMSCSAVGNHVLQIAV